jgi:NAD(P)-dependent dehydrogenase (short-subunit alcohol dehydrogenase family)
MNAQGRKAFDFIAKEARMAEGGVAVVTGATGGIGLWIALGLARTGCRTVLVGRDRARVEAAGTWIARRVPGAAVEVMTADLASLAQTKALGERIAAEHPRLSILVNNAGIFRAKREVTAEGREAVLAVNHLSPFLLTRTLGEALRAGAPSRIVNIGSDTADRAAIDPDDLELTRRWDRLRAYRRSKLALMMTSVEWSRRLARDGITVNVAHPGAVATSLVRAPGVIGLAWTLMSPFLLSAEQGADTPLHLAVAPEHAATTGGYFKRRRAVEPNPLVRDERLRARVWEATERLLS